MTPFFIDRSRWETYHHECARKAYLRYWFGPTRHGITARGASLPLVTGGLVDTPISNLLARCVGDVALPADLDAIVRAEIRAVQNLYRQIIEARGFDLNSQVGLTGSEEFPEADPTAEWRYVVEEQCALIEGLVWVFVTYVLPRILEDSRLVAVQAEETYILDCTCGLPPGFGVWDLHKARGCAGVVLQAKPDLITESRLDGTLRYEEIKSQGYLDRQVRESWQDKMQFLIGMKAAEVRLGRPIDQAGVHLLLKGMRRASYRGSGREESGPKRQQSILCYGYRRAGIDAVRDVEYFPKWEWVDQATGMTRRLGKGWEKVPIWEQTFPGQLPEMSPVEYWVKWLGAEWLGECYEWVGPLDRMRWAEDGFETALASWARRCQEALDRLVVLEQEGCGYPHPQTLQILDTVFPQSWQCWTYRNAIACEFRGVCRREANWEDPLASGQFLYRRPHHDPELQAAVEEGWLTLTLPEGDVLQDEEEA